MLYALCGHLAASVGRFAVREYRDSHKGINAVTGQQMAFTAVLRFGISHALLATGAKIAACWP